LLRRGARDHTFIVKLLIVDDHPVLREGLATLLRQAGPQTCVLQARNADEALALLDQHLDLDVVVLDLVMPGMGGLAALTEFARRRPDLPVVVLSSSEDPRDAREALAQGALGYVPKSASPSTLLSAISMVLNGDLYVPPLILNAFAADAGHPVEAPPEVASILTERQIQVLRLLSDGSSNKMIANRLALSEKTVKVHISAIFKALRVLNRTQAASAARTAGLI
jgi:DNA-binding NarL/FixJ family response regulator